MESKHSGLGVAAFVISLIIGALVFLTIVVAGIATASTPGGLRDDSPAAMLIGLVIIGLLMIDLVALALGIAGVIQRDRKKVFAVLGLVFSAATIVGTLFLAVLGNMM